MSIEDRIVYIQYNVEKLEEIIQDGTSRKLHDYFCHNFFLPGTGENILYPFIPPVFQEV
jgi:hypothetical protein